jgi:hypothetical protein
MSGMQITPLLMTCTLCEKDIPFDTTMAFATEEEMSVYLQTLVDAHECSTTEALN